MRARICGDLRLALYKTRTRRYNQIDCMPSASTKAALDNRAVQKNPKSATYYRSRGEGTRQAEASAQAASRSPAMMREERSVVNIVTIVSAFGALLLVWCVCVRA